MIEGTQQLVDEKIGVIQVDAGGEVVWTKKERNILRLVHAKMRRFEITRNNLMRLMIGRHFLQQLLKR